MVIRGGTVVDGTGAPPFAADVAISGDRISAVSQQIDGEARITLDAGGCLVCPGFIDAHSHSDTYLLLEPLSPSKVMQGITTEIIGQCGASAAPLLGRARLPGDWRRFTYPGKWRTFADYRRLLEDVGPAVNVRAFVGHNTLRGCVTGYDPRPADSGELARMRRLLAEAMDQGAAGLSSGLAYPPGRYAAVEELIELNREVAEREGVYSVHLRNESTQLAEAASEVLHVARLAGVRLEISHLKLGGRAPSAVLDRTLETIERYRADGVRIAADAYPYTASATDLDILLPEFAFNRGPEHELNLLWDARWRARITRELEKNLPASDCERIIIATTVDPANRRFRGRSLRQAAEMLGKSPAETVIHLLLTDQLMTQALFSGLRQEDIEKILRLPYVCIGTDASLRSPQGLLGDDHPHPRAYGSFPRFLRMCLDGLLPLAEAVRKMTGLPAAHFGLTDRGLIRPGAFADLCVIEVETVRDTATYQEPHRFPQGIQAVIVNGVLTVEQGTLTGRRGGRFLALQGH